ncbi:hypothetical protein SOCE26_057600 [Sorangium cellulosum]|uniref:Uncharacterized protein n=1 Tax=Sorangium cellulosum TaxID=56 RepID=A0A2L0EYC5_SORCE|nr:hypothetical protein [Sorangium cellulosum]AUX44296.1 hypothetical protein SOCE26_057600 [Sorangium cellulosum]
MSLRDLAALYLLAGLACAVAVYRASLEGRRRAALSAALCVPLWPIWAPIALTSTSARGEGGERPRAASTAAAARVQGALREGVDACAGTALEALLSREAASRIEAEVARAAARHAELDALLRRGGFDEAAAAERVAALERGGAGGRALATAHLHLDNIRRLRAMRDRDARALEELADLVHALRTQLVLARFAGSSVEGASGIVSEVWARVEGLGVAIGEHDGGAPEASIET